ncbi:MAG: hypothetical protein HYW47_01930 [Deltaproteobacteria bacterium]|nr:hypothetical protein [Deltaproteobacteria bacterium]
MKKTLFTLLLSLTPLFSFAGIQTAPKAPWFNTIPNLFTKEALIEKRTLEMVTPTGLLLYKAYFPWTDKEKYLISHDIADLPAWQGYLMASYAFKEAVTGKDFDPEISKLADGLLKFYEVTGIPGLLGRSVMPDYTGPMLPWMVTKEQRPTAYWIQGPKGQWWRNGVAKDHVNLAVFGCSIPLALERRGQIHLTDETRQKLISFMLPLVQRIVYHGFQIIDWNGQRTEYGSLRSAANGFNQLLMLHMLATAAPYDRGMYKVYRSKIKGWHRTIGWSLEALGQGVHKIIENRRGTYDKPSFSDMQALGLAYLSLYFQEHRRKYMKSIRRGMEGVWKFMRYERNPMFAIPYVATIRAQEVHRIFPIIEDLRDFPVDKYEANTSRRDTKYIQPLANRPYNTNYWKSSPFRAIAHTPPPKTGNEQVFAGMDYLLAYWTGRYFNLVPHE